MADFEIDGIAMPRPSSWVTKRVPLTSDSERLPGSGRLVAPYICMVLETEWTYKTLTQAEYDVLYDAYVLSSDRNKSIEHTIKTLDSNTGLSITYKMYLQSDFTAPLKRIRNGVREYVNISFTFVGVGGGE